MYQLEFSLLIRFGTSLCFGGGGSLSCNMLIFSRHVRIVNALVYGLGRPYRTPVTDASNHSVIGCYVRVWYDS